MKRMTRLTALGFALAVAATAASAQPKLDRTMLPIAEPKRPTYTELDARKAKPPARFEVTAPKGAPNVVIVLIDDIGFGGPSTFGGPIRTPTMDALAQNGLRFNNFHTTALCSPTRNRAQDRPQPPHRQHRLDHGELDGLPRQHRADPEQRRAAGGDAAAQRLQHRRLRQVARDGGLGDQRVGPVRPLADAPGLRQVLRLHRRRDRPVVPADLRRRDQGRAAEDEGLPLHAST